MRMMKSETGGEMDQPSVPMRLSVLFPTFKRGGAELSQLNVLQKLAARGWLIDILTYHPEGPISDCIPAEMNLVGLDGQGNFARIFSLSTWLRSHRPPIAFAFEQRANMLLMVSIWFARLFRPTQLTRTVLCQRFPLSFKRSRKFPIRYFRCIIENALYRRADRVVAISDGLREDISFETGRPVERINVIRNPKINADFIARFDMPLEHNLHPWIFEAGDGENERPLVVSCGVLETRKNHSWLIDRFAAISSMTNARLVIIGEGPLRKKLEEKISHLKLEDRVALVGFLDNPLPVFRMANLVVHCSVAEGLSNIFVEALACNTPVLGLAKQHGISEVLENGRWGRIAPDIPATFEEQLLEAIQNSREDRKWLKTQDKGLERFDAQRNVDAYDVLLRELLHAPRRSAIFFGRSL